MDRKVRNMTEMEGGRTRKVGHCLDRKEGIAIGKEGVGLERGDVGEGIGN